MTKEPSMAKKSSKTASFNFAAHMKELEEITAYLESDEIDLDTAIIRFERGSELAHQLQDYLQQAENRIETIKKQFGSSSQ